MLFMNNYAPPIPAPPPCIHAFFLRCRETSQLRPLLRGVLSSFVVSLGGGGGDLPFRRLSPGASDTFEATEVLATGVFRVHYTVRHVAQVRPALRRLTSGGDGSAGVWEYSRSVSNQVQCAGILCVFGGFCFCFCFCFWQQRT